MTANRIPVDLVTGFLGVGKTTFINAVLRDPAFAGAMVVVNEFGEIGLDHVLMSTADDQVVLLDSGCLCCAASGTLRDTLIDLSARRAAGSVPVFDRVIVETSGLAHPGPLIASLLGDSALVTRYALAQVLTLVDAVNGIATLDAYAEARRQVACADRILISKIGHVPSQQLAALRRHLEALNADAPVESWRLGESVAAKFSAPLRQGGVGRTAARPQAWLRGPLRPQYAQPLHAEADAAAVRDADAVHGESFGQVRSMVLPLTATLDWDAYATLTRNLSARLGRRLLRCKGLLAIGDEGVPWVVQGVQGYFASPQRLDAWPAKVPQGFLVCIGESVSREELESIVAQSLPLIETH
ncbi:MAG: GTP-binding protein [Burkholderiaceae bacterium]|nr:GTP-binding protein [Burkholderiaceae bacterium]MDP1968799.1 GTP-binding protein [Burkholderiaceae bacterium]